MSTGGIFYKPKEHTHQPAPGSKAAQAQQRRDQIRKSAEVIFAELQLIEDPAERAELILGIVYQLHDLLPAVLRNTRHLSRSTTILFPLGNKH